MFLPTLLKCADRLRSGTVLLLWLGGALCPLPGLAADAAPLVLQLPDSHQFQFAGFYAAQIKGYYDDEGLDVLIQAGMSRQMPPDAVLSGTAAFGVADASLALWRMQGLPVVALATIEQHSPQILLARADAGIRSPQDLVGQSVALTRDADSAALQAMLLNEGVAFERVRWVTPNDRLTPLLQGQVNAQIAMLDNEPFLLQQQGVEYDLLWPINYGIDFYGDTLFTSEERMRRDPAQVAAFRRASLAGWHYALEHPEEIIDYILATYGKDNPQLSAERLRFEAGVLTNALIQPGQVEVGHMNPFRWRRIAQTYAALGLASTSFSLDGFLYESWNEVDYAWIGWLAGGLGLVLLLLLGVAGWNLQLRRKVQQHTYMLRQSEERFRDFAEAAADFFWEMDAALRFVYLSPGFREVTGLDPRDVLGRTRREVHSDQSDRRDKWERHFRDLEAHRPYENFEYEYQRPDGAMRVICHSGTPVFDKSGVFVGYRGAGRDVTETYRMAQELVHNASHDVLTGLVNRREFEQRLERALAEAKAFSVQHALCYLDLDQFKVINDTCGHSAGDELLRQLGALLRERSRRRDTLARLGGDEFALLVEHCALTEAVHLAESLRRVIEDFRFIWEGNMFSVGVSIGVVPITEASQNVAVVLSAADTACYSAKDDGRNRIHLYREDDEQIVRRNTEMRLVSHIGQALEENRFHLTCQTIAPIGSNPDLGPHYELLIRMQDVQGALVSPGVFLPAAERYHLSARLDRWVIDAAFRWLSAHPEHLNRLALCSINLSGHFLGDKESLQFVVEQMGDRGIPPERICFEITETAAIANFASASYFIRKLRDMGCSFALDDFGSGLSSFAYLKNLPVDFLKIDGAFVRDLAQDPIDLAMVRSINEVGHNLGKKTVAEFVENATILNILRDIGVDYVQGYHIGKPQPLDSLLLMPA